MQPSQKQILFKALLFTGIITFLMTSHFIFFPDIALGQNDLKSKKNCIDVWPSFSLTRSIAAKEICWGKTDKVTIIVRHAENDYDPNENLTPVGCERARQLSQTLAKAKISTIFSSQTCRAVQTASYLSNPGNKNHVPICLYRDQNLLNMQDLEVCLPGPNSKMAQGSGSLCPDNYFVPDLTKNCAFGKINGLEGVIKTLESPKSQQSKTLIIGHSDSLSHTLKDEEARSYYRNSFDNIFILINDELVKPLTKYGKVTIDSSSSKSKKLNDLNDISHHELCRLPLAQQIKITKKTIEKLRQICRY